MTISYEVAHIMHLELESLITSEELMPNLKLPIMGSLSLAVMIWCHCGFTDVGQQREWHWVLWPEI